MSFWFHKRGPRSVHHLFSINVPLLLLTSLVALLIGIMLPLLAMLLGW